VNEPRFPSAESPHSSHATEELTEDEAKNILLRLGSAVDTVSTARPLNASGAPISEAVAANLHSEAIRDKGTIEPFDREGHFLEAMPDAVVVINRKGAIVQVNAQAERLFGYNRDELLGHVVELLVPERPRNKHVVHRAAKRSMFGDFTRGWP